MESPDFSRRGQKTTGELQSTKKNPTSTSKKTKPAGLAPCATGKTPQGHGKSKGRKARKPQENARKTQH
jgi:hypothetical protein